MATFVLVHGTGHGGWCWKKVASLLRAQGHEVYTPTLSGLSDRSHLAGCGIDLSTHIQEIRNLILYEDIYDVLLVGHSYAGMVISGVAARISERFRHLIYLDAYLPDDGQSEIDLWPAEMRAEIEAEAAAGGGLRPPPDPVFLGISDPRLAEWVKERITGQPIATYTEPVPNGNAQSDALPRAYIACTVGLTTSLFGKFAGKARARGWKMYEIATGHDAMLTTPNEVADILRQIAGPAEPLAVVQRWVQAMDRHDLEAAVACFAPDYRDEAPARRGEFVHGQAQVRANFKALFQDIPDLRAELLGAVPQENTVWMEWRMQGKRRNGLPFEFAGINIFGVENGQIVWGRIYTELVRDAGPLDTQIRRMTEGSGEESH